MSFFRSLIYIVWLYGSMTAVGLAFAPFALFSRRAAADAGRAWTKAALWGARALCGLSVEVRGREHIPTGAALVACKHQAMLDTLLPFETLPDPIIVLKQELKAMPVFGWYAMHAGMIALDREGHGGALRKLLKEARAHTQAGRQIFIFPEGTRQAPGAQPAYKPGVAALYRDLKVPCTPVALNTGLFWPAHGVTRKPGVAIIEFLAPIAPGLSREAFMAELEQRIEARANALLHAS
jgi:1-acyl-sn-glycerol-3-phosphate acyltransferase